MKKVKSRKNLNFRNLTDNEKFELRGGLCILPSLLGQRLYNWLSSR